MGREGRDDEAFAPATFFELSLGIRRVVIALTAEHARGKRDREVAPDPGASASPGDGNGQPKNEGHVDGYAVRVGRNMLRFLVTRVTRVTCFDILLARSKSLPAEPIAHRRTSFWNILRIERWLGIDAGTADGATGSSLLFITATP